MVRFGLDDLSLNFAHNARDLLDLAGNGIHVGYDLPITERDILELPVAIFQFQAPVHKARVCVLPFATVDLFVLSKLDT